MGRALAAIVAVTVAVAGAAAVAGCGDPLPPEHPRKGAAAKSKARTGSESTREAADPDKVSGDGKQWGGWRYAGSRDDCFFVVKRRCFQTEEAACKAAKCGDKRCVVDGGGPATMRCR